MAMLPFTSIAGDIVSKDWVWNIDDNEIPYAATTNSAGQLLGQYCYPKLGKCMYLVGFSITCEEDSNYPALVNTDKGAQSIQLICGGKLDDVDQNVLMASNFDELDKIIRGASRIGFVIPMQSDDFKAVRFSLRGAEDALDRMRAAALKLQDKPGNTNNTKPAVETL